MDNQESNKQEEEDSDLHMSGHVRSLIVCVVLAIIGVLVNSVLVNNGYPLTIGRWLMLFYFGTLGITTIGVISAKNCLFSLIMIGLPLVVGLVFLVKDIVFYLKYGVMDMYTLLDLMRWFTQTPIFSTWHGLRSICAKIPVWCFAAGISGIAAIRLETE